MKKIKGLLFAFVALFAFTLAMVTVKAVSIDETYTFDLTAIDSVAQGATKDVIATSSANPERKSTMTVAPITVPGVTRWKDTYLEVQCKVANFKEQFIFNTANDATVTMIINTGGGSKNIGYSVYDGEATTTAVKTGSVASGNDTTAFEFVFTGSGKHIIEFSEATKPSSNMKVYSISLATTHESSETPEQLAEAAIDRIGTVAYSEETRTLIAAATSALADLDTSSISNYDVYTAAVSQFNALVAEKKSAFTNAVAAIGTVTADSVSTIETALAALDQLLDTEVAEVSTSIKTLRNAQDELFNILYDSFAKKLTADDLAADVVYTEATQLGNTIFKAYNGVTTDGSSSTIKDGTAFSKRIKLNGAGVFNNGDSNYVLGFEAKTAGTLKIVCVSGSTSAERTLSVYLAKNKVGSVKAVKSSSDAEEQSVEISEAGMYYIGSDNSGINVLSVEFVPTPAPTMPFYQDAAYNDEGVELVRYVAVVEGVSEEDIKGNFSLIITSEALEEALVATNSCVIANELLNGEEAYTIEDATFEVKDNTLYVVCVLGVSGGELGDKYKGAELTATLTVNGSVVGTFNYTVQGVQAE